MAIFADMLRLLGICMILFSVGAYGATRQNTIQYTVENQISNDDLEFQELQHLEPAERVFLDIMDEAAENDDTFRYESIDYGEPLGHYVYEINGLSESVADQTYWALLKRDDVEDCLVSTDGLDTIEYTVENKITGDDREFHETLAMVPGGRHFIDIMDSAAMRDSVFQYKSTDYGEPLGEFIYEINNLAMVVNDTYWAFLLREDDEEEDCFLPVGASNFVPEEGDHVVFSYFNYNTSLPVCDV